MPARLAKRKQQSVPPPTPRDIDKLRLHLKTAVFIEMAAILAGIRPSLLYDWFVKAMQGDPEFTPVLDMYREETALLAKSIMEPIYKKAFQERDMVALQFLYNNRVKRMESRFLDKLEKTEDTLEAARREGTGGYMVDEEQIAEAEARQLEAANRTN